MPERRFAGFTDFVSEVQRMNRLGRTGREDDGPVHHEQERSFATAWVPTADMFARGADLVIRLELPGMAPDDVAITASGGTLSVAGERRTERGADPDSFYVRERYRGAFRRSMTLPEGTPAAAISATFDAGIVEIVIAGAATGEPERIALEDRGAGRTERRLGGTGAAPGGPA